MSALNTTLSVSSSPKLIVLVPPALLALNHTSPSTLRSPNTCTSDLLETSPVNTVSLTTLRSPCSVVFNSTSNVSLIVVASSTVNVPLSVVLPLTVVLPTMLASPLRCKSSCNVVRLVTSRVLCSCVDCITLIDPVTSTEPCALKSCV